MLNLLEQIGLAIGLVYFHMFVFLTDVGIVMGNLKCLPGQAKNINLPCLRLYSQIIITGIVPATA